MLQQSDSGSVDRPKSGPPPTSVVTPAARYEHAWRLAVEIEALISSPDGEPLDAARYQARVALSLVRSLTDELEQLLDAR